MSIWWFYLQRTGWRDRWAAAVAWTPCDGIGIGVRWSVASLASRAVQPGTDLCHARSSLPVTRLSRAIGNSIRWTSYVLLDLWTSFMLLDFWTSFMLLVSCTSSIISIAWTSWVRHCVYGREAQVGCNGSGRDMVTTTYRLLGP